MNLNLQMAGRMRVLLASVAVATLTMSAASAETLRWARVGDALTLDPHSQNEGPTHTLNHHIYETLVGRATDGTLTPRLATEWEISAEDDSVWVFRIREGVTFHDGTPSRLMTWSSRSTGRGPKPLGCARCMPRSRR
jgi:peptide/nickel transport system substrate-binding protein